MSLYDFHDLRLVSIIQKISKFDRLKFLINTDCRLRVDLDHLELKITPVA